AALVKAGISSPAAWSAAGAPSAAGSSADVQVIADSAVAPSGNGSNASPDSLTQANDFDPRPPVVLMKGTNNKNFLISWRSQQEVARSLGWKCTLMIWGGPPLALLSLYLFLNIEHLL